MNTLELKVPPPVVALVLALAMWAIALLTPTIEVDAPMRVAVAVVFALIGGIQRRRHHCLSWPKQP